jgi:hypothetical protein
MYSPSHRQTAPQTINIQPTPRTDPDFCQNVSLRCYVVATVIHIQSVHGQRFVCVRVCIYIYIYIYTHTHTHTLFLWRYSPTRTMTSAFMRFLDLIRRRITVGRTPLDEQSARRRDLYLTTHNTHNRHPRPNGIRTHNLRKQAAADLRLRPRVHWDLCIYTHILHNTEMLVGQNKYKEQRDWDRQWMPRAILGTRDIGSQPWIGCWRSRRSRAWPCSANSGRRPSANMDTEKLTSQGGARRDSRHFQWIFTGILSL